MDFIKTGKAVYQIQYQGGIGITKISQHSTAKSAEDELRLFKEDIKKEDLKEVMKNVKVFLIEELEIINLGKGL